MPPPVMCHHCKRRRATRYGGDLYCRVSCQQAAAQAKQDAVAQLVAAGFTQVPRVLNLWVKNGVHLSIGRVLHEGFATAIARHSAAAAEIHA
jgi:hypothetical protein